MASHAVTGYMQMDGLIGIAEGFLRQPDVSGAVFDEKNLDRLIYFSSLAFMISSHFPPERN